MTPLAVLGFAAGLLHVLNHSIFKGLLFLAAGAVQHAAHTLDLEELGGLAEADEVDRRDFSDRLCRDRRVAAAQRVRQRVPAVLRGGLPRSSSRMRRSPPPVCRRSSSWG